MKGLWIVLFCVVGLGQAFAEPAKKACHTGSNCSQGQEEPKEEESNN